MVGEIWDFGDTFNTSDSQSVCSTDKSRDSLVKFSNINIISHNPSTLVAFTTLALNHHL